MPKGSIYLPTQAVEFSGPDRNAVAIYCPGWTGFLLALLEQRPMAYEASWRFAPEERAHVLEICYEGIDPFHIALMDGMHNGLMASLTRGKALVLSPNPMYRGEGWEGDLCLCLPALEPSRWA